MVRLVHVGRTHVGEVVCGVDTIAASTSDQERDTTSVIAYDARAWTHHVAPDVPLPVGPWFRSTRLNGLNLMRQSSLRSGQLDEELQHYDWRAAAPAIGLRSLAAVAMTVPALLAVGVYWLRHVPVGTGMPLSDNVMQVRLVVPPSADASRPLVAPAATTAAITSAPPQVPTVAAAAAEAESVTARDSTAPGSMLAHLPAAPAWDASVPGSPLVVLQTKPDQKTTTFVRTVKSHIARFQYYPERAQRERIHGQVGLVLTLRRDGTVTNVLVASSSGVASLDAAAVDTVRRAQPLPSIPAELPGQLSLDYTIAFDLPQ